MKSVRLMAPSAAALALHAAPADAGGGSTSPTTGSGAAPDPVEKSSPTPQPLAADQKPPSDATVETPQKPVGPAAGADPNPPVNKAEANKSGKKTWCVWVQPGHEVLSVGQIFTTSPHDSEALRSAGRARYASDAEVAAAKASKALTVEHLEGL